MWSQIASFILRSRASLIAVLVIVTAFMAWQGSQVRMSYAFAGMLPKHDSTYIEYQHFIDNFSQDGNVIMLGVDDERLYELDNFQEWYDLAHRFKAIEVSVKETIDEVTTEEMASAVDSVFSMAHSYDLVKDTTLTRFKFDALIKGRPKTQAQVDSAVARMHQLPFYKDLLYKEDNPATIMMVFMNSDLFNSENRGNSIPMVNDYLKEFEEKTGIQTYVSGLPVIRVTMMEKVKAELQLFIALAAAVTAILLLLFFKNLRVMIVCLAVVGIGVTWSLGFIALFDYPITVLMGLIPPLMIVIGVPNCIYLVNKYHAEYKKHGNKAKALSRVVVKVGNATLLTNATTAMGFATFIFVESDLLQNFGVIAAVSIMSVFLISVLTIPIVFSFMAPPKRKHVRHLDRKWIFNAVNGLVKMVSHHRTLVYIITAFILVFGVIGISKMETTGNVVDDLPQTDKVITDLKWFEENYNGVMPFEVLVETERPGQITKSKNLRKIEKLQKILAEYPEFSKSLSIVDASKFAKQAFYNGNPSRYALINRNEESFIGPYLQSEYNTGGAETTFVDSTKKKTRITVQVADIGTKEMEVLLDDLRPRIDSVFPSNKYKVTLTGTSIVYSKGTSYMVKNLMISLALAISVIALVMLLLFRSGRMVLIALLPNIIPLVFTGAIMGYAGIPIKPSTILVFSIAFGISVDDTIHFLAKYRQELKIKAWNIKESVLLAVKETGVSMMYTSIVLFFGFGMFSMSEFDGTKALGILVSMTLLVAMFANLVLLPSLLLSFEKYITTKAFKEPLMVLIDEEEDIELEELQVRKQDLEVETDQAGGES